MSLLKAFSIDLAKEINAEDADIAYQNGRISSQKNFCCPNPECRIAVTCANLERPKHLRKVAPYFKSVEDHKHGCPMAVEEKKASAKKSQQNTLDDFYGVEKIADNITLFNLVPPAPKKQNTHTDTAASSSTSAASQRSSHSKSSHHQNQTKTFSSMVSSFLDGQSFPLCLPFPYIEYADLQDIFIEINGQDLSDFEQNCWRIYYGKAWINKVTNGYQIKFDNVLHDAELVKPIRPSFFIAESESDDSAYEKFSRAKMNEMAERKIPKQVFILADVPALNHSKQYINFRLEDLQHLEIKDLK